MYRLAAALCLALAAAPAHAADHPADLLSTPAGKKQVSALPKADREWLDGALQGAGSLKEVPGGYLAGYSCYRGDCGYNQVFVLMEKKTGQLFIAALQDEKAVLMLPRDVAKWPDIPQDRLDDHWGFSFFEVFRQQGGAAKLGGAKPAAAPAPVPAPVPDAAPEGGPIREQFRGTYGVVCDADGLYRVSGGKITFYEGTPAEEGHAIDLTLARPFGVSSGRDGQGAITGGRGWTFERTSKGTFMWDDQHPEDRIPKCPDVAGAPPAPTAPQAVAAAAPAGGIPAVLLGVWGDDCSKPLTRFSANLVEGIAYGGAWDVVGASQSSGEVVISMRSRESGKLSSATFAILGKDLIRGTHVQIDGRDLPQNNPPLRRCAG